MTVILNTWIFENDIKRGMGQVELVDRVTNLGADGIEVRREYFNDFDTELLEVATHAKQHNLIVNYSIPDVLFEDDGSVNPNLKKYFAEGEILGAKKIKFNTGHFDKFTGDLQNGLGKLPLDEIELNVENDQTQVSGTVAAIKNFLDEAHSVGLKQIGYVYDLGNWAFTDGDAEKAAIELAPYTNYIHLKNTEKKNARLVTTDDLDTGMFDWRKLLDNLPNDQYYALEYPMDNDEKIKDQIQLLKNVVGG